MLDENFFVLTFSEILSMIVTIASVGLIVKQLNESRLASQMEGFLELGAQFGEIAPAIEFIDALTLSSEWNSMSAEESYRHIFDNEVNRNFFKKVGVFYEILGALLQRGVLDNKLAMDTFGAIGSNRWQTVKKVAKIQRSLMKEQSLYEHWEWFAKKFDN
jgi:hypothetical protein